VLRSPAVGGQPQAVVVGTGIVGLSTAWHLQERGWHVRLLADRPLAGSTSYLAAAVWFPTRVGPRDKVVRWGAATFDALVAQAGDEVPGVVMRESLALYREPPGRPWWAGALVDLREARPDELPPGYRYGLRFTVPLVNMTVHLPWLAGEVVRRGAVIETRHLASLDDATPADLVVCCAGLGARELVGDDSVTPVRGQIVRVANPGLTVSVRDEQHPAGRAYVHPRSEDVILGGSLEEGSWNEAPDPATAESIIARCTELVPQLAGAPVVEHIAGLRPGRPTVRLERGADLADGTPVIHHYGHGGAGITLGWECAREAAVLADSL
jgi:D-amino-acid oxidase